MSEVSGVDLARVALRAAQSDARQRGNRPARKNDEKRPHRARRSGRDPLGLGDAINALVGERGWTAPTAGGGVFAEWEAIVTAVAPDLTGRTQAVQLNVDTGQLDVVPKTAAEGTMLRWTAPKLIARINQSVPGSKVRTLHVLPPSTRAAAHTERAATVAPAPAPAPETPVRTRETASNGYRLTLAAHQTSRHNEETEIDARIRAAAERQTQALLRKREPEAVHVEAYGEQRHEQRQPPPDRLDASIRAALAYKHRHSSRSSGQPLSRKP
ncbi:DciA family protein [Streptomyces sp. NBC_01237]|uniref:DciA family protein n=1 Tax=Streptomyces sp. NBC_01237 TaxID=2903790 RepID=UPI002DD91C05|nr:DciA family protein [Streptomyces sp. NBC_01237]WRZ76498.1 DciA family protein [Streptomyces sp. NBC_01237]